MKRVGLTGSRETILSTAGNVFMCGFDTVNVNQFWVRWNRSQDTYFGLGGALLSTTTWSQIDIKIDTTQADASSRMRVFLNGAELSVTGGSEPGQNAMSNLNQAVTHNIGRDIGNADYYFDGYLADVNVVDGRALDASAFGQTAGGTWGGTAYQGTYGTNGFHVDFSNPGAPGADVSGRGNSFTTTNMPGSATGGCVQAHMD